MPPTFLAPDRSMGPKVNFPLMQSSINAVSDLETFKIGLSGKSHVRKWRWTDY